MKGTLHHVCIAVKEFDWYQAFFEKVFEMTIQKTAREAPCRQLWFCEGIQLNEDLNAEEKTGLVDHISLRVEDIPQAVKEAVEMGCTPLPNGAHWFALPNGVKIELK